MSCDSRVRSVPFAKYQGLGNDFVVLRSTDATITSSAAQRICDRRRGVGADGVLTVSPSTMDGAAYRMHVFNADGSEAEMCGNGLRCVVRFLDPSDRVSIETGAGILHGWIDGDDVSVTMGAARSIEPRIEAGPFMGTGVSMGNPHLVLDPFGDDDDLMALAKEHGRALEQHPRFEARTNVGFCRVDDGVVTLVVFERGAGITEACGTGASAAVAALASRGVVPTKASILVDLPGGRLAVRIDPAAGTLGQVTVTGEGRYVFDGTIGLHDAELA